MVRGFGAKGCAGIAQALFANLGDSPERRRALLVEIVEVGENRPVETARFGDRAAECVAVPADVFGQRIDGERRANRLRAEKIRGGDRVIDDVQQTMATAKCSDAFQIGHLRTWIGDCFDEDHACFRTQRCLNVAGFGGVHERNGNAELGEGFEQAGGVAEQETTGDQMVAAAQECEQCCRDRAHAAAEGGRGDALFHARNLLFQRRCGGGSLSAVNEASLFALKNLDEIGYVGKAKGRRIVNRFMNGAVLDRFGTVAMQCGRRESAGSHDQVGSNDTKGCLRIVVDFCLVVRLWIRVPRSGCAAV